MTNACARSPTMKEDSCMKTTASDLLIDSIQDWGVDVVFGLPGDGINGIMEALRKRADKIRFIQVRHEEAAAFMACAYAKYTGKLGVCLATSGPGGLHLLNGLYDAKLDGQPVLAITGLQYHDLLNTHTQQDVELDKLFMDVAVYNCRVMGAAHAENVMELAIRTALARRGVAHVTVPVDVQDQPVKKDMRSQRNIPHHVSDAAAPARLAAPDALLTRGAGDPERREPRADRPALPGRGRPRRRRRRHHEGAAAEAHLPRGSELPDQSPEGDGRMARADAGARVASGQADEAGSGGAGAE